jgi:diguanylate cyclase
LITFVKIDSQVRSEMIIFNTLRDLIANLAIVTAYLFLASQVIFKSISIDGKASIFLKVKLGLVAGMLGIILMLFSVKVNGTLLDFRQLALILSALFGGILSSVIAGLMIFLTRMFAFGPMNTFSVIAATNTIAVAIVVGIICEISKGYWSKWSFSLVACNILTGFVFILNLWEKGIIPTLIYFFMMFFGGILTALLLDFLNQVKRYHHRMEKEATHDFLTGLNNHRVFDSLYNGLLDSANKKNEGLSLALIDIDHYKKVNDTYGHVNGDAILNQLGKLLRSVARPFDTVSRNGGEEFSILMYDTPHEHALHVAEKMRNVINKHAFSLSNGEVLKITVSIGVASFPDTLDDLIEQADKALYMAKDTGRDRVCSSNDFFHFHK